MVQLSGHGLFPWTVPKQTSFLQALQQASRIQNDPRTSFGFCNISSDPLSFADIPAATGRGPTPIPLAPPAAARNGRRRLAADAQGNNAKSDISPAHAGRRRLLGAPIPYLGSGGDVRVLERRKLGFLPRLRVLSEEPRDTVDVYVRLTIDYFNVSGTEFWNLLTGPLPDNSSEVS